MRQILLPLLLLIHLVPRAQKGEQKVLLTGRVIDSLSGLPIDATLTLTDKKTALAIRTIATREDGTFEFRVPTHRASLLHITGVGYQQRDLVLDAKDMKNAVDSKNSRLDLGGIPMTIAQASLKDVVVTAGRPVIKREIDRISYDVQADPDSKANDALEMLRKVPMVTVDAADVVQLKGSTNFQIFINGKPSALMTANPSDVLKAMPAATILRIEVITVPPSKYDAEGLVGIINIITLQTSTDGVNGSLFARYNSVFGERGSASVNVGKGRLSMTGLLGIGRQPKLNNAMSTRLTTYSPASVLSQDGVRSNEGNFNNGKADLSYEVDSFHVLTAMADFFNRQFNQVTSNHAQLVDASNSVVQSYSLLNAGPVTTGALDAGLGYQFRFRGPANASLIFSYRYAATTNSQGNTVTVSDKTNYNGNAYVQKNNLRTGAHNFEVNFVRPLKKWIIETGAKAILARNDSHFSDDTLDLATGQNHTDTEMTNDFRYHQAIYSGYGSGHLLLAGWELKAGLRLEYTQIHSSYAVGPPGQGSTSPGRGATSIGQDYLNLLPALSLQWNLAAGNSFTLGYTQRIQRALPAQLNPFVDKSDPTFLVAGNPGLRPVVNNILELAYSRSAKLSVNAGLDLTFSNNPIQKVTELLGDSVSESTYQNAGRNRTAGIHLTLNDPLSAKLNLTLNIQLSHVWLTGIFDSQSYSNDGTQGNAAASARYALGRQLTISLTFNYNSGNVFLQGKSGDYAYFGFNVIQEFWRRRATLSITAFSPWSKFTKNYAYTSTPAFEQYSSYQFYDRNFRVAFNYKFGRLDPRRKKAAGEEE
jgi:outer membrane receptor for ferrienterochelin and colicin